MNKLTAITVCLLAGLPVIAGEGRIPIWQPITIGPGQEGSYVLTRDITAAQGSAAIDIQPGTVAVDIDLNGFTIYGASFPAILAQYVDSLTVRNGTIMGGGGAGIWAEWCRKVVIEDMKIEFIEGGGIWLMEVKTFAVRRNIITNCDSQYGITADGYSFDPSALIEGTIEGNVIRECLGGIVVWNGSSVAVINNRIEETEANGIYTDICNSCLFERNTVESTGEHGFEMRSLFGSKIHNNLVSNCDEDGINLVNANSTLILNNVASENGGSGLVVVGGRYNQVDRNIFTGNGLAGIWFYSSSLGNTYGRNTLRGNLSAPGTCVFTPPTCGIPDLCDDGTNNTSFGDNMGPGPGC
jgi:parallel beta-helix repeat protein